MHFKINDIFQIITFYKLVGIFQIIDLNISDFFFFSLAQHDQKYCCTVRCVVADRHSCSYCDTVRELSCIFSGGGKLTLKSITQSTGQRGAGLSGQEDAMKIGLVRSSETKATMELLNWVTS